MRVSKSKDGLDDISSAYFKQIRNFPLIGFEEELELSRLIQKGDQTARQRLVEANLRLVIKIAKTYYAPDVPLMDMIQEGNMGLVKAVDKYDHAKNVRFSTCAVWWIRQAISRFLLNKRRTIRLPHRKEEIFGKIQRAYHTLSQLYSRQPKNSEIAAEINAPLEDVESVINITSSFIPLGVENGADEASAIMSVQEDYTYCPEKALIDQSFRDTARKVLEKLKARERRILIYHYQLNGGERCSLKKIGDKMGISPETVRQIKLKAIEKIRGHAEELQVYY